MVGFTKNEKKTLKLLIEDGRISDTDIAEKLKITKQAVGKIRKKLEQKGIIKGYSTELDYNKLGIQTFALAIAKLNSNGWEELGDLGTEQLLQDTPHIVSAYRIPEGNSTHILLFGFRDLNSLDRYFSIMRDKFFDYFSNEKLYIFSHYSLIKDSPVQLFRVHSVEVWAL